MREHETQVANFGRNLNSLMPLADRRSEALAVVGAAVSAGRSGSAGGGAAVSSSTTLTVLGLGSGRSSRSGSLGGSSRALGGRAASAGRRRSASSGVGGTNVADLDVRVDDGRVGVGGLDVGGLARGGSTSATSDTGSGGARGGGVRRVEPEHVDGVVVPDGEDEGHSGGETSAHASEAALVLEGSGVAEGRLLVSAVLRGDGVVGGHSGNVDLGVLNDLAVLDVDAADLLEGSRGGTGVGEELSDDGELLGGVDGLSGAVEGRITHAVRVEVAAIGVADGGVAVGGTAGSTLAARLRTSRARVGSVGSGHAVSLPDIHLVTAGSVVSGTSVGIVGIGSPAIGVCNTVDELDVSGALGVAVSGSVLGTSLVRREPGNTTVGVHLGEVEGTVETTGKVGDIDVEGELLVENLEKLVLAVAVGGQHVDTGTDVLLRGVGHELEGECIAACSDTVGARVVSTVKGAVLGASGTVGTESRVPGVTGVAVVRASGAVEPAPVGVEDDLSGLAGAARRRALLPGERRVGLSGKGANLLGECRGGEGKGEES